MISDVNVVFINVILRYRDVLQWRDQQWSSLPSS